MAITPTEKASVSAKYKNSPKILFGKILEMYLANPQPEFGVFQSALANTINEYFQRVFQYRQKYGFGMNGTVYVPPAQFVPVVGTIGGSMGSSVNITSFTSVPTTQSAVTKACKDQTVGFWGRIFELMGNHFVNTTIVLSNPAAFSFLYTLQLRSVYPTLPQQWLLAGKTFGDKIRTKQVDDKDYLYMSWSEELNRLIRATTAILPIPSWPVVGGLFSGTIAMSWADFNTLT